ncbi:MAG: hypothetical protein AB7J28_07845 [Hyphomonadaceae bacterium]
MGEADKINLRAALEQAGWRIETEEVATHEWWLFECWRLTSTWRPVGAVAYVLFLVDPLYPFDWRDSIRSVDAIAVHAERRIERMGASQGAFYLARGRWTQTLKEIVQAANALRPNQ